MSREDSRRGTGWITVGATLAVLGAVFVVNGLLVVFRGEFTGVDIAWLLAGLVVSSVGAWMLGKVSPGARSRR